ncbi:uncharacterized protein [Antedon mediterranea]|uniref:uncharacterized protein n=1 Tax=Antedon mediterranea TaxID=105859 RepID=UPI003AF584B5
MDIVSMALSSAQRNSELLVGLGLTQPENHHGGQTEEEGVVAREHSMMDRDSELGLLGLGLDSNTCRPASTHGAVVSTLVGSISENCAPVFMMGQDELLRPSNKNLILRKTEKNTEELSRPTTGPRNTQNLQNGKTINMTSINVARNFDSAKLNKITTASSSSLGMHPIPVELSSSTSAASSILGSIASMIDPNAANLMSTISTSSVSSNQSDSSVISRTNRSADMFSKVGPPIPSTVPQPIAKEEQTLSPIPLQTKSAATITIKTPPGTSLTGPSGSMSGPLLQTILNNAEVQALMKRNPGQQITIVQVPDESLGSGNWGINSSIKSAINEANKFIPATNTKTNQVQVGRKRKKFDEPDEKQKTLKVTRPVKKITRSGRISRPPLYRIRDYKTILPTEEVESDSSEEEYEDYTDKNDKDISILSDKPKNFKCTNCDKSYIGQASLDRHFRQNPTHGTPVGLSPVKKQSDIQSEQIDSKDFGKLDQISSEPGEYIPVETASSQLSRVHNPLMRGRGRGVRKRRGRGRPPVCNYNNKTYNSAGVFSMKNTEKLPLDKRKQKAKELLNTFVDDDFLDVILPRLPRVLTPWEFLLMKIEGEETKRKNFVDIYNEYLALVKEIKKIASGSVTRISDTISTVNSSIEDNSSSSQIRLDIVDDVIAASLGLTTGYYEVKDSLIPAVTGQPTVMSPVIIPLIQKEDGKKNEVLETSLAKKTTCNEQMDSSQVPKNMPTLTPLRNRPLNLKSVVTPGPIAEHPIPPGRPLPELKPIMNDVDKVSVSDTSVQPAISTPSIIPDSLSQNLELTRTGQDQLIESFSEEDNEYTDVDKSSSAAALPLLPDVESDGLQELMVEEDVLGEVDDTSAIDIMPVGSTLMQLQDGIFIVQRPDGTTMQIQAPDGMSIETIQELLSVDGRMQFSNVDTTEMSSMETNVSMVSELNVNPTDLSSEVAPT